MAWRRTLPVLQLQQRLEVREDLDDPPPARDRLLAREHELHFERRREGAGRHRPGVGGVVGDDVEVVHVPSDLPGAPRRAANPRRVVRPGSTEAQHPDRPGGPVTPRRRVPAFVLDEVREGPARSRQHVQRPALVPGAVPRSEDQGGGRQEIFDLAANRIQEKNIELDAVLIRDVGLPEKLKQAIERKLEQEQSSLEYEFRLTRAEKEAERQRIEAEGKAAANRILSQSLTDKVLKDKGIEATLRLAESPNSKVIVVGGGGEGLPLILGNN